MTRHCERAPVNSPGRPPPPYRERPLDCSPPPAWPTLFLHEVSLLRCACGTCMIQQHPGKERANFIVIGHQLIEQLGEPDCFTRGRNSGETPRRSRSTRRSRTSTAPPALCGAVPA